MRESLENPKSREFLFEFLAAKDSFVPDPHQSGRPLTTSAARPSTPSQSLLCAALLP